MKVLYVHHKLNASFIKNDLKILQKHYDVEDFYYTPRKTLQLFKKIKECDLIYIWFISYPAYFVTIINKLCRYKKPVVLVAGGYGTQEDVLENHKIFKLMAKTSVKYAKEILAVSKFTKNETIRLLNVDKSRVKMIYNGIDLTLFKNHNLKRDSKMVLTVGNIFSMERYYLKGIDKFIEFARTLPNVHFYVVGMNDTVGSKIKNVPKNCHFLATVSLEKLVTLYNKANIYCQFSRYETFCLTLLEARACGCEIIYSENCSVLKEITEIDMKELTLAKREKKLVGVLNEYRN